MGRIPYPVYMRAHTAVVSSLATGRILSRVHARTMQSTCRYCVLREKERKRESLYFSLRAHLLRYRIMYAISKKCMRQRMCEISMRLRGCKICMHLRGCKICLTHTFSKKCMRQKGCKIWRTLARRERGAGEEGAGDRRGEGGRACTCVRWGGGSGR